MGQPSVGVAGSGRSRRKAADVEFSWRLRPSRRHPSVWADEGPAGRVTLRVGE